MCPFRNKLSFKTILHDVRSASHSEAYPAPLSPQLDMTQSLVPVNPVVRWLGWESMRYERNREECLLCCCVESRTGRGTVHHSACISGGLRASGSLLASPESQPSSLVARPTVSFHPCGPFKVKIPLFSERHIIQQ